MVEVPEFEIVESEDFKVIYVTGFWGAVSPGDGRMMFHVDRLKTKPKGEKPYAHPLKEEFAKVVREKLVEIRMSPLTWKKIAKKMMVWLERLEKEYGEIEV